jgi:hypothetical protein
MGEHETPQICLAIGAEPGLDGSLREFRATAGERSRGSEHGTTANEADERTATKLTPTFPATHKPRDIQAFICVHLNLRFISIEEFTKERFISIRRRS